MRSAFDTRAANFDPDQAAALSAAYRMALEGVSAHDRLPTNTKAKLAKVIVNLGRERVRQKQEFDLQDMASRAADFIKQLRTLSLLE